MMLWDPSACREGPPRGQNQQHEAASPEGPWSWAEIIQCRLEVPSHPAGLIIWLSAGKQGVSSVDRVGLSPKGTVAQQ